MSKRSDNLTQEWQYRQLELTTRRHFLRECRTGLGMMAFGSLLSGCDLFSSKSQFKTTIDLANP
ncbi:MAG: hypothetical protein RL335_223, partial [Bacteroidota bacterium]